MTSWNRILREWVNGERQLAFDLPVSFDSDGSQSDASCSSVLTKFVEPIFREAGECTFFGTKLSDDSFLGQGAAIRAAMSIAKGRGTLRYSEEALSQYASFFANNREVGRGLVDLRGTVAFLMAANSRVLSDVIPRLGEPKIEKNYPTAMDKGGLRFARDVVDRDPSRVVVCLPGRTALEVLYVFAAPRVLEAYISGQA